MDSDPRPGDDLPAAAELSGVLREAVESIRGEEPPEAALARVLERARQVPAAAGVAPRGPRDSERRRSAFTWASRGLAAALAVAVLAAAWIWTASIFRHAGPTLAAALRETLAARTLELKLTRDGKTSTVWISGTQLRQNHPDGTYEIARENRLWTVDERENRASSEPSPFEGYDPGPVLLALMNVPPEEGLLDSTPAERTVRDGRPCDIYRWHSAGRGERLEVEAAVEAGSRTLSWLEVSRTREGRRQSLGQLAVVARNRPVADALFVVGDTLTEDGRIGKVTDSQGVVALRPATADRWTPLAARMLLRPGDWLRTDIRGANAVSVRLVKETRLVLGPGTLVELVSPKRVRVFEGELKIAAAAGSPVELIAPGGKTIQVDGKQLFRVETQALVKLEKEPLWLRGYEGKTTEESLGSLVARIDGRDVPLSVGYHKVAVDIRDQIARTTIEESFVNHTKGVLEGVFYFPLPQDASIAGFGMWIGDQLVEADVVEKQRAREIYETILRERRDPGLLEWAGGNIFKARVYPIPAMSEKRIKITYTQVLPLRAGTYRYQYALQSELLRQHPLRQLEIDVKLSSAVPLRSVSSPTHATRNTLAEHSARVEFTAQEYTPTQDFEVVVETAGAEADVVTIPHRRGEDGYFMVQLTPPGASGQWRREVLPNGEPIELLILADTSASMDAASRAAQAELVAALLGALAPKDKINLATCDVDCNWAFERSRPAEARAIAAARQFLAGRISLGWTDLDKAMASALRRCGPGTQVVYIGDGIPTTGDGDPVAFAKRLRRLAEGHAGTFHAVATGSSFEPLVLKAIAALGGGSVRQVTGSCGPVAVAGELLAEMTEPALRDVKVEFRGLRTARVYPEELPNLPLGTQQIILGRYLPENRDLSGEVILTGTEGGKPVRLAGRVTLKDGEEGNSFIPRLWARMHLDALLQQGASPAVRDEVIALSEEYHIITPYTSLLVLESDADRERFGVKRRFQMRDGEKFFAQGRDNANWELVQQQMKRAGTWRLGLRRDVLRQLATLGRDESIFQTGRGRIDLDAEPDYDSLIELIRSTVHPITWDEVGGPGSIAHFKTNLSLVISQTQEVQESPELLVRESVASHNRGFLESDVVPVGGLSKGPVYNLDFAAAEEAEETGRIMLGVGVNSDAGFGEVVSDEKNFDWTTGGAPAEPIMALLPFLGAGQTHVEPQWAFTGRTTESQATALSGLIRDVDNLRMEAQTINGEEAAWQYEPGTTNDTSVTGWQINALNYTICKPAYENPFVKPEPASQAEPWLSELFPPLPPAPAKEKPLTSGPSSTRGEGRKGKLWPDAARKLAEGLLRSEQLFGRKDGLRIEIQRQSFDPRWNELAARSRTVAIASPAGWLVRSAGDHEQTTVAWCDARQRGVLSKTFQLGRVRNSTPEDLRDLPLRLADGMTWRLDHAYCDYAVEMKPQGDHETWLVLKAPGDRRREIRVLVDTRRAAARQIQEWQDGKVTSTTTLSDFVAVGGVWWPGRIEETDDQGRRTRLETLKYTALDGGQFDQTWKEELAGRERVLLLGQPLPRLVEARQRAAGFSPADGSRHATAGINPAARQLADELVLMLHFRATQQWDRVLEQLGKVERAGAGKPGLHWLRDRVLVGARRRDEARRHYLAEAAALGATAGSSSSAGSTVGQANRGTRTITASPDSPPAGDDLYLADYLLDQCHGVAAANEMLSILKVLRPVYARQPEHLSALKTWQQRQVDYLESARQTDEALALRRQLAVDYPRDYWLQWEYGRSLVSDDQYEAAYAWIDGVLGSGIRWLPEEEDLLRDAVAGWLRSQGRYDEWLDYLAAWVRRSPPERSAYRLYLVALAEGDRAEEADALVARWLQEGRRPERLPADVAARLGVAVERARQSERWQPALAEAAIFFARHPSEADLANDIMNDDDFSHSAPCRRVRKAVVKMLRGEAGRLSPTELRRLVSWIAPDDAAVGPQDWKQIAAAVRERWADEPNPAVQYRLGQALVQVLSHVGPAEVLDFLREQVRRAPQPYRAAAARQLFRTLLAEPWSAEHENEAFALLEKLSDAEEPASRLAFAVAGLYRLTDRMVGARFQAAMGKVEHREKLTRSELRRRQEENLRLARQGFRDHLQKEAAGHQRPLGQWITIERLYLDVLLGKDLDKVAEGCFELLGPEPKAPSSPQADAAERGDDEDQPRDVGAELAAALRHRTLITLLNLSARKRLGATAGSSSSAGTLLGKPAVAPRLLAYLQAAAAAEPKQNGWRALQYQLLVALDRPKELEAALRRWIDAGDAGNVWRASLARLLAEQGRIADAVALFEKIRARDGLSAADDRLLADWYTVLGRRQSHDRTTVEALKASSEWELRKFLTGNLRLWQQTDQPPPRELDPRVPLAFSALLEKANDVQNHLDQLQSFYAATHDFRLLAALADAMVGQTAGKVYPLLQGLGGLLAEVRDEATADSLVDEITRQRGRAKTDVDRRALDLLEMQVERRAAELQNQPGPHRDRALAALARSWQGQWSPGEPRLMAELLAALGKITQPALAAEQLRQLKALHQMATPGSIDRLQIAQDLAATYAAYGRLEDAVDLLSAALDEYQAACGGVLPASADDAFSRLLFDLEGQRHFARGAAILFAQLNHPASRQQGYWLMEQLYELYRSAISRDGEVSLGRGAALYEAVQQKLLEELKTADQGHRPAVVEQLLALYRTAHEKNLPGVEGDLRRFAFHRLPELVKHQVNYYYDSIITSTAETLHDLIGPRDGLELLVTLIETEPSWVRHDNDHGSSRADQMFAQWRLEAGNLGELEPRLLAIVLAQLRVDLQSQRHRNRAIYYGPANGSFWQEKAADFAHVAGEVAAKNRQSGAAAVAIADYLVEGLKRPDRAVEILLDAHRRQLLDDAGQEKLARLLQERSRYAESVAVLQPLVRRQADNITYRVLLMRACFHTARSADLTALLKETDAYFHQKDRWCEWFMCQLAEGCLESGLPEQSAGYWREAIAAHQHAAPRRGIGDDTLGGYYGGLARAYAGEKKTPEAADAACGAVVSWGPRQSQRAEALATLQKVLDEAQDLDGYLTALDRRAAAAGEDNAIVRKAAGQVYAARKQYARAVTQLRAAEELQPGDAETYRALLERYDRLNDQHGAIETLLRWRELDRRDAKLYEDLGRRLALLGQGDEAERAYTSIVEMLPNEAESHQRLAEIRQHQNRWPEAIVQWQQVARLRELEPTGLLGLTAALVHEGRWDEAAAALAKLEGRVWPPRFGGVEAQIRPLHRQIDARRRAAP